METNSHLHIEHVIDDDTVILLMTGDIDEFAHFPEIKISHSTMLVLDLKGIKLINSLGIRNWIRWIRSLKGTIYFTFRNCPKVIVDQMNVLDGFMPLEATVESFFIPYDCPNCGLEENFLARRGKDYVEGNADTKMGLLVPEHKECPSCHNDMEWSVIPDKYFKFLKYRR